MIVYQRVDPFVKFPGSPVDQTIRGWSALDDPWVARISDPTNGQSLVGLDFLGFAV